jgi:hypothetical protein
MLPVCQQKFQLIEEGHLQQMKDFVDNYAKSWKQKQADLEEVSSLTVRILHCLFGLFFKYLVCVPVCCIIVRKMSNMTHFLPTAVLQ